jgi:uncharacterized lipoprotein YbaY
MKRIALSLTAHCAAAVTAALSLVQITWAGSVVSGTATYRDRIALSPDAAFEATLEDVSNTRCAGVSRREGGCSS